jgi:hypothetical protein
MLGHRRRNWSNTPVFGVLTNAEGFVFVALDTNRTVILTGDGFCDSTSLSDRIRRDRKHHSISGGMWYIEMRKNENGRVHYECFTPQEQLILPAS